jgi:hypothetical protein
MGALPSQEGRSSHKAPLLAALVMCAFTFCWWANADFLEEDVPPGVVLEREEDTPTSTARAERGERKIEKSWLLSCWPEALRRVRRWLEPYVMLWRYWKAYSEKPPPEELRVLLELLFSGRGLYLYAR